MTFNLMLNEVENAAISDFPFGVFKPLTNPVSVSSNGWLTAICDEEFMGYLPPYMSLISDMIHDTYGTLFMYTQSVYWLL